MFNLHGRIVILVVILSSPAAAHALIPNFQTGKWYDTCPLMGRENKNIYCLKASRKWLCFRKEIDKLQFIARLGAAAIARSNGVNPPAQAAQVITEKKDEKNSIVMVGLVVSQAWQQVMTTPPGQWGWALLGKALGFLFAFLSMLCGLGLILAKVWFVLWKRKRKGDVKEEVKEIKEEVEVEVEAETQAEVHHHQHHYTDNRRMVHEYHIHVHAPPQQKTSNEDLVPVIIGKLLVPEKEPPSA